MNKELLEAFSVAEPRPLYNGSREDKKNYAERLSRELSRCVADGLRKAFPGILPDESGKRQESMARTSKGFKRLDVNYSTPELGLALGVSIKTINFADPKSKNYRKNYTRVDAELRAEVHDYHERQPFSVLVAVVFLPIDACDDARGDTPSSFGLAVKFFRNRAGRRTARDESGLFERVFIGLYEYEGKNKGTTVFFDVEDKPPRSRRPPPTSCFDFAELIRRITLAYDLRNNPPFEWAVD